MSEDILADSWLFKELIEKGKQKGLEEGKQKGLEEGKQKALDLSRQTIIAMIKGRYPSLVLQAKTKVENINNPEELQELILHISLAVSETDARAALEN